MIFRNLLILLAFLTLAAPAQADPKPWMFGWAANHDEWTHAKKFNPHLENGKHPHITQWADEDWYAQDWISQRNGDGMKLIRDFYTTEIIHDQDEEGGVPVLVVGPSFYRLSGFDKRRVVQTVDAVYGITRKNPNAVMLVRDWHTERAIGVYNEYGLQTQ